MIKKNNRHRECVRCKKLETKSSQKLIHREISTVCHALGTKLSFFFSEYAYGRLGHIFSAAPLFKKGRLVAVEENSAHRFRFSTKCFART